MVGPILDFVARGPALELARAIESDTERGRGLTALVVPWESDAQRITLSLTVNKRNGWAIEHTNVGTVTLTDLGDGRVHVSVVAHEHLAHEHLAHEHLAHEHDSPDRDRLVGALGGFAQQLSDAFRVAAGDGERIES